jgi:hypothetical protein
MANRIEEAREALQGTRDELLARANVVAVGVGWKTVEGEATREPAIVCSVEAKRPREALRAADIVPAVLDGVATDVVRTGPIFAHQSPTGRFRPAPGGVSIGHVGITAGTLGCVVRKDGRLFILSNNHVLANSNDAAVGDAIVQPGAADGGRHPADTIARLHEWVPIVFESGGGGGGGGGGSPCAIGNAAASALNAAAALVGSRTRLRTERLDGVEGTALQATNLVDCAIAEPLSEGDLLPEILGLGAPTGIAEGTLGAAIRKSGRTTGITSGTITQVDVTVRVSFAADRTATFVDQLMAGGISQGGDSGSAILDESNAVVGLLFAGSVNTTIMNRIQNVFQALGLALP